jgi:hypothetical protein
VIRSLRGATAAVVLAIGLLALTLLPAQADDALVPLNGSGSLTIPGAAVPNGFSVDGLQSYPITKSSLSTTLGEHASVLFQNDGWVTGYHGWLNADDLTYKAFVTYDFYGFKTESGAAAASNLMLGLALGVQTPMAPGKLPPNTEVFVDSTGTFGPDLKPFVAVEVVFYVQNVLADVTGYYEGGGSTATDDATTGSIDAASGIGSWLASQTRNSKNGVLPLILMPVALAGQRSGRRRQ